ncbi:bifunctional [glutamate--ammonia ligase]-adenylyl-L-tyrosine phosphorylase/[glutamate--ammonia-ligase] adenylyltransferase [Robbsia sp. Bb-Pol-6]|uniref:Bifunctional glutamine synthetase adenylyltransferase/adenylyl-removing enzyme n=1 Tax=Robbsia betulipollinis TaxID=2981849 RepID=A0ABT3ZQY9_9BURK|nr:bifunctional [glutamate--ammonia ligase]-adenylyl-L-tyrosine phosphorylase/[glutamate--ammonia-ligase] adenylyltransferase [Robbsia betulipollinis]MCY0388837.1 bifunctional [glutamate--ammonia ligase]-adenylyl-L-tyrosine phosphorylase/[glutamate--ammonia-ligase] adenylyltransferase [Robbsia betulipollinis]
MAQANRFPGRPAEGGADGPAAHFADLLCAEYSRFAQRAFEARPDVRRFVVEAHRTPLTRQALEARFDAHLAVRLAASPAASAGDADTRHAALCAALRLLRTDVFCLLMARDLAGLAGLDEVTGTMSDLAEVTVGRALVSIERALSASFGVPQTASAGAAGSRLPLTLGVVGMGKLGGRELNVSSDIDLIFVYEEEGETAGGTRAAISNHDFFTRVARKLIGALAERTAEGYVFRVDMRLRPNGDSGPLVASLAMLEEYFYVQGREWERYAWIKGRLLPPEGGEAGDGDGGDAHRRLAAQLDALVRPFVYRRYLDFGVIDAIRSLHEQIGQEARRRASLRPELADDVKLGRGGIREIEFGAQVFQLVRGGQDAGLRVRPTLQVLARAAERGLIGAASVHALDTAYRFLRQLEHRLQYADDAQTHAMPVDPPARARLAASLGFADYAALHAALDAHRAVVEREFEGIFDKPDRQGDPDAAPAADRATAGAPAAAGSVAARLRQAEQAMRELWSDALFDPASSTALETVAAGLGYPGAVVARLRATRMSLRYVQMPLPSRARFDALVERALAAARAAGPDGPDAPVARLDALARLLDFLEKIGGRSAYVSLLTEYPAALQRVFSVLGNSQWAARYLITHPQLLDELLDDDAINAPFDWAAFTAGLRVRLAASDGVEQQMDQIRHAQHAEVFRILLRDLAGHLPVETISDRLSELADAVLGVTLETVWRALPNRPACDGDQPRFAIIAYGKLGGKELGYASDLDLIFLYDNPHASDDGAETYAKLARRLVSWLTTATGAGLLYDIDLRLRPNGSSGLLVTPLEAFRQYQLGSGVQANTAWVWEHQAITRARFCAGDARIGAAFETIRAAVIASVRAPDVLAAEIVAMRERSREGHPNRSALFDIKHDRGGMVDIEFIVQYLVLAHAAQHPVLVRNTGNISLLNACAALEIVTAAEAEAVGGAYRRYRALQHRLRLDGAAEARVPADGVARERQAVLAFWDRTFALPAARGTPGAAGTRSGPGAPPGD